MRRKDRVESYDDGDDDDNVDGESRQEKTSSEDERHASTGVSVLLSHRPG